MNDLVHYAIVGFGSGFVLLLGLILKILNVLQTDHVHRPEFDRVLELLRQAETDHAGLAVEVRELRRRIDHGS